MTKIVVMADVTEGRGDAILLEERVVSIHLSDGHAAEQLIERLGWAVNDAEELERATRAPLHA
jgi:hypothetical protein